MVSVQLTSDLGYLRRMRILCKEIYNLRCQMDQTVQENVCYDGHDRAQQVRLQGWNEASFRLFKVTETDYCGGCFYSSAKCRGRKQQRQKKKKAKSVKESKRTRRIRAIFRPLKLPGKAIRRILCKSRPCSSDISASLGLIVTIWYPTDGGGCTEHQGQF